MGDAARYFVTIQAPDRRSMVQLGRMGLDLFGRTTVPSAARLRHSIAAGEPAPALTIEGLIDIAQLERLVHAGYRVTVEAEAGRRARAAGNVIEFEQWLKEMGE